MKSFIKKSMMLGIGLSALSKDKVQSIVSELKKKGDLTAKESKELVSYLAKESEKKHKELKNAIDQHVQKVVEKAKKETKKELKMLEQKLIKELKKRS
jgi:polyhydroxyalkanoate synthesis regulator phasin